MQVVTYYDENGNVVPKQVPGGRVRVQTHFVDEKGEPLSPEHASQTQQQFAEQCDVNYIMKTYVKTQDVTLLAQKEGVYADVSQIKDLRSSLQDVMDAEAAFMTLPADLRKKLDHDPAKFIEYLNDSSNDEEAVKYGLKNASVLNNDDLTTMNTPSKNGPKKASSSSKKDSVDEVDE